jgi:hypothetical protein
VYVVNETPTKNLCPNLDYGCPELEAVFEQFTDRINIAAAEGKLDNVEAVMLIDDWQQDLKKATYRIGWDDEEGERKTYEHAVFIHRNRGGE